ncbi:2-hydroxychromene-2-carboxylate isomerase [Paraglaciecola polaris]|uniref:2-hydroxychromene-2-carboxylate isomerase n=1 Tax=Paraglaciecola polaris LMG 21857 TaxID=1129793 RepID=K6Z5Y2_9ALTE|nr:2-hydroxychromene-2-carboxylate isomerase [Paraglaciecola polaris]GAC31621.1 2-hydroxychromene-2-carboxylate isomerase [Paraglaciecola polaris LMG 21857]
MSKKIEFFFDVGSPTAFLADGQLRKLAEKYAAELVYEPMLLGAVHQASKNMSPALIPAKGKYMAEHDLPRFIQRYGCEFNMNPHFPINTLTLMRGCYAAKVMDIFEPYLTVIFNGMWVKGLNLADETVLLAELTGAGIDGHKLLSLTSQETIKDLLKENTGRAIEKGVFGAPTMFIGKQMYFGQDRLDFIEQELMR